MVCGVCSRGKDRTDRTIAIKEQMAIKRFFSVVGEKEEKSASRRK
jgi:hypothetical protein